MNYRSGKKSNTDTLAKPVPGVDYVINMNYIRKNATTVFVLPEASDLNLQGEAVERYEAFRQCWVILRRTRPVVPCPENTPLTRRFDSREKKATLLSVYLRPWTLIKEYGTLEVPYLPNLKEPSCRTAWKRYLSRVLPASERQLRNFVLATMAEGRIDAEDEEATRSEKLSGITSNLTLADVDTLLHASSEVNSGNLAESYGKVEEPLTTIRILLMKL